MKFRTPQYRHHASGQATVHIKGKDFYLGVYGTPESKEAYRRIINEYLTPQEMPPVKTLIEGPTVNQVMLAYLNFAKIYYVKNGQVTAEFKKSCMALRPLKILYGSLPAQSFGLAQLKAVRQNMIDSDLCRNVVNERVNIIRRMIH